MTPARENPGLRKRREKERAKQDEALFEHLGAIHRLEEEDLELLTAIAAACEFTRKSDIFVRPSVIEATPDKERWSLARVRRLHTTLSGPVLHPTGDAGGKVIR